MKTIIVDDIYGKKMLVSLENVLSIRTGGGTYNHMDTIVYINYGFDQVVSWEVSKNSVDALLLAIKDILESD